jgi:hypothetical protein
MFGNVNVTCFFLCTFYFVTLQLIATCTIKKALCKGSKNVKYSGQLMDHTVFRCITDNSYRWELPATHLRQRLDSTCRSLCERDKGI